MKTSKVIFLVFLITISLFIIETKPIKANPIDVRTYSATIAIISPKNNTTFTIDSFSIIFSLTDVAYDKIQPKSSIPFTVSIRIDDWSAIQKTIYFSIAEPSQQFFIDLTNLTEGNHNLCVFAVYSEASDTGSYWISLSGESEKISFSIETSSENFTRLNPSQSPVLAMPYETVNYTITQVNGKYWAKIDEAYQIHKLFGAGDTFTLDGSKHAVSSDELNMFHPTPPGSNQETPSSGENTSS